MLTGALVAALGTLTWVAAHAQDPSGTQRMYEVRGAKLYVETLGHGPPVLFLHGGMNFFALNFAKQRDYFAAYRTVVGIEQRGHGHSPDGPWPLSYQLMADDTAALIQQLGLGRVDVVGHSDGANVGLLLARDHPELVGRLVISGANLRSGLSAEEVQRRSQWSPEQLAEKLRTVDASMPPSFRTEYADLKRISAPVLVMAGDNDFTSIEETVEIYRGLPKGQLIILPATGHGTMQQRPELVNLAIREFLEQSVSGATTRQPG
jgi:pimeloyl-ACP methyl ester carboxylesterase